MAKPYNAFVCLGPLGPTRTSVTWVGVSKHPPEGLETDQAQEQRMTGPQERLWMLSSSEDTGMPGRRAVCRQLGAPSLDSALCAFSLGYFNLYPFAVVNQSHEYISSQWALSGLLGTLHLQLCTRTVPSNPAIMVTPHTWLRSWDWKTIRKHADSKYLWVHPTYMCVRVYLRVFVCKHLQQSYLCSTTHVAAGSVESSRPLSTVSSAGTPRFAPKSVYAACSHSPYCTACLRLRKPTTCQCKNERKLFLWRPR